MQYLCPSTVVEANSILVSSSRISYGETTFISNAALQKNTIEKWYIKLKSYILNAWSTS